MNEQVKPDELDDWFDEEEQDEDQSANDTSDEDGESSAPPPSLEEEPDTQTPVEGAAEAAPEAGTSDAAVTDDPYAWMDQLDPELKAHAEALAHQNRSNTGRVAALTARLDKATAQQDAKAVVRTPRRKEQAAVSEPEGEADEALTTFESEYPTVAANVKKLVDAGVAKEREEILKQVTPLREAKIAEEGLRERQTLRNNAAIIFNSAETGVQLEEVIQSDMWKEWINSQPDGYREFARNAKAAADATKVLEDFAQHAERQAYLEYNAAHPEGTAPVASEADQVAASRRQALAGTSPPSKSGSLKDAGVGSYEEWFDHFVDKYSS